MSAAPQSEATSRIGWIDARNGVAGDMLLAALLDAGASLDVVRTAVEAVLPATVSLTAQEVRRAGLRACRVEVSVLVADLPHRDWTTIRSMLQAAPLKPAVRQNALAVFEALARAEARAHGIEVERVHFHEVGAWDSIADIVGVCAALDDLALTELSAGPVGVGSGSVRTSHGEIPVPVPAVLELATGWSVLAGDEGELATPTGMALVTTLARPAAALPDGRVLKVGLGAGSRDDPGRPNVVRVVVAQPSGYHSAAADRPSAWLLEANVDDLDPRLWPGVLAALLDAGADDAWLSPILMKKGRPAHTLHVLGSDADLLALRDHIFRLVPTLGVREVPATKHVLERDWVEVLVDDRPVRVKVGHRDGRIVTATPEFDDVVKAARALGVAERDVLARAIAAAEASGLTPGAEAPALP